MKIILGLGNPGYRYRNTRHNIGFMVVDSIAAKYRIRLKQKGFNGVYGVGRIYGHEVMLFKPLTYMNLSGEAAAGLVSHYRLNQKEDLLVVSDDFALPLGTMRIREKGSSGGHNGLESIIGKIDSEFARLRIGIGAEEMPEDRAVFVLSSFPRRDRNKVEKIVSRAAECAEMWVDLGAGEAAKGCSS